MQYTYNQLLASCKNYCIDLSTEYETEFPFIVQLAEMRIIKDLNLSVFDLTVAGTMVAGTRTIPKPSGYITILDMFVVNSSTRTYIQQRTQSWLDSYWPNSNMTAQPSYYADADQTTFTLAPTPDQNYGYQINYIARPTPMSSTNQTTWIGDNIGECLLYGAMTQSMVFFRENAVTEQNVPQDWERLYEDSIAKAKYEMDALRQGWDRHFAVLSTTEA